MKVKAIFFNLGNVLISVNGSKAFDVLQERSQRSRDRIKAAFREARFEQYELGFVSTPVFFEGLKRALGFDGPTTELSDICSDVFTPIQKNVDLAYAIASRYPAAILSNTNPAHIDFIGKRYKVLNAFTVHIYSYQEGLRKPDRRIYERAIQTLNALPEQSLLIDDLEENVKAASDLKWNVIHYCQGLDLANAMRSYGIHVD